MCTVVCGFADAEEVLCGEDMCAVERRAAKGRTGMLKRQAIINSYEYYFGRKIADTHKHKIHTRKK